MLRILLFLLAFLNASPAVAAVEIAFYSHEMSTSGDKIIEFPHAFITMRGPPDAGGRPIDGNFGFTADRISPAILLRPVKGRMVSAGKNYIRASRRHFALRLTDAQYASVRAAYARWASVKGKSYDLDTRNCVHFVAEMAKAAGLAVPTDDGLFQMPAAFLEAVTARNRDRVAGR